MAEVIGGGAQRTDDAGGGHPVLEALQRVRRPVLCLAAWCGEDGHQARSGERRKF